MPLYLFINIFDLHNLNVLLLHFFQQLKNKIKQIIKKQLLYLFKNNKIYKNSYQKIKRNYLIYKINKNNNNNMSQLQNDDSYQENQTNCNYQIIYNFKLVNLYQKKIKFHNYKIIRIKSNKQNNQQNKEILKKLQKILKTNQKNNFKLIELDQYFQKQEINNEIIHLYTYCDKQINGQISEKSRQMLELAFQQLIILNKKIIQILQNFIQYLSKIIQIIQKYIIIQLYVMRKQISLNKHKYIMINLLDQILHFLIQQQIIVIY
ncbi:hypothetical protein IMG5_181170 [Ichthyophthirius multifiliis]|uniref:Uncharacterized protein n=1 Tax=Ichthyophthirius multifiliis TaxID=5932 RepID=G0R2X7_ICHMU|nr:hypothetical protein IMG5_181170 [Ichthyophthirius multifiliis]EGR28188.1 hypothetical protein IMG5_181170 [Ichthyophthirius multifiliis]|eukprot:XP_004027533.1 hypothetical protein IMG5_181170 [Ichthyophthirius multifiliis]